MSVPELYGGVATRSTVRGLVRHIVRGSMGEHWFGDRGRAGFTFMLPGPDGSAFVVHARRTAPPPPEPIPGGFLVEPEEGEPDIQVMEIDPSRRN